MDYPLISIIIPVYNTPEVYLKGCLKSVLTQYYKNIEVLIIDDGSIEEVAFSCDEIAKLDARIKVVHQKNQGVSVARNNGTKVAKGDYVIYVDADDLLACHSLEEAHNCIVENNADLVISGVKKIKSHSEFNCFGKYSSLCEVLDENGITKLKRHYLALDNPKYKNICGVGYINRGPYCRLIKREIALSTQFPEGMPIGEDLLWNINLLSKCNKVCIVYNVWYGYLISSTSAIRKYYGNRIEKVEEYLNCLYNTHKAFCLDNIDVYGKNVAVEFYCILRYELLSPNNNMSYRDKNIIVHKLLESEPWIVMANKEVKCYLSKKYRLLLFCSKSNLWQFGFKIMLGKE
jgi:glycosyltransferase involved in cell wall biosynthesis